MESPITDENLEATLKFLLDNDRDHHVQAALEERFPILRPDRLPPIVPKWDLSADALKHNTLREDILAGAILHIAEPSAFLGVCTYSSDYATDDLERRSSSHKLRRILDLWASEVALTPPVFMWLNDKLLKLEDTIEPYLLSHCGLPRFHSIAISLSRCKGSESADCHRQEMRRTRRG